MVEIIELGIKNSINQIYSYKITFSTTNDSRNTTFDSPEIRVWAAFKFKRLSGRD
jgi:hypothetical protein